MSYCSVVLTVWWQQHGLLLEGKKTMVDLMCLIQVKNNLELWYVEFFSLSTHVVPKPPHSSNASTRSSFKVRQNVCLLLCAIVTAHRLNKKYCHVKKPQFGFAQCPSAASLLKYSVTAAFYWCLKKKQLLLSVRPLWQITLQSESHATV